MKYQAGQKWDRRKSKRDGQENLETEPNAAGVGVGQQRTSWHRHSWEWDTNKHHAVGPAASRGLLGLSGVEGKELTLGCADFKELKREVYPGVWGSEKKVWK